MKRFGLAGAVFIFAVALFLPQNAAAQRLFSDSSELQLVIEGPIGDVVRTARRSTDPVPATVTLMGGAQPQTFQIQMSPRGFSRRTLDICNFPPLRLDFDKPALRGTLLQGQNRLKLVTRCRPGANYEQFTVLEYTAYRLYNEITPYSFRVRPVRVTFRDNAGRRREETQLNFLIEDAGDVAQRNHRVEIEVQTGEVRSNQLDPDIASLDAMFQYMIGNLDWDMTQGPAGEECCHNGKLLASSDVSRERVAPVPYDFDFSGFVNAPYAMPPEGLPVRNVRERYYRGYCRYNDQARTAAEVFRSRRQALYAVVDGETRLTPERRQTAHRYLESFFEILDDPERFNSQVIARCR